VEHATNRYRQGLASYYEVLGGGWKLTDTEWPGPAAAAVK
jgi:hypothetical protein